MWVYLELESLGLLPAEVLVGEVPILRSLEVDRLSEVKLLDDDTRTHIKVGTDDGHEFVAGFVRGTVRVDLETS